LLWLLASACDDWDSLWVNSHDMAGMNTAFITSTTVVPGQLGGLDAADRFCQDRADAAGLQLTFRAWLSSSTSDARSRVSPARAWLRTDGRLFAASLAALTDADAVLHALRFDESGNEVTGQFVKVATGSHGGSRTNETAMDWTSNSATYAAGDAMVTAGFWDWGYFETGSTPAHLYCFSIDGKDPPARVPTGGRLAFLSTAPFAPSTLSAADAHCQSDADGNGHAGSYRALLSTAGTPAAQRFDLGGPPWVRVDGVPWLARAQDLADNLIRTSLNVDARGIYRGDIWVWTGSLGPGLSATSPSSQSCNDWAGSGMAIAGRANLTNELWWSSDVDTCDQRNALYCLQQ